MPLTPSLYPLTARSTVYGVILNDSASLQALDIPAGALAAAPYKGAPRAPVLYIKPANTHVSAHVGTGATVTLPPGAQHVEVAATVGLVLGRDAAQLAPADALNAVSHLVLVADLSLPHASYYRPAIREKCFDGALPLAQPQPLQEVGDVRTLVLRTEIDGVQVAERRLDDLIRPPAQLLADVTEFMTLRAGDVLLLGVRYQAPQAATGSRVRVEAVGLGTLEFDIAGESA